MSTAKLTRTQRKLLKEIEEITELLGLNYTQLDGVEKDAIIPYLRMVKDQFIRSQVIMEYVLIDELLSSAIAYYFFGKKQGAKNLWRTKKFQNFDNYILEKLYLLQKLELVEKIIKIPPDVNKAIRRINDLRNGLAHSFFPEDRRKNKPVYKKKNIYSIDGLQLFEEDREKINNFFLNKLWG